MQGVKTKMKRPMMMFGLCRACRDGLSLLLLSRSNALGGEEGRPENPVGMHKYKINKLRAFFPSIFSTPFPLSRLFVVCLYGWMGWMDGAFHRFACVDRSLSFSISTTNRN